MNEIRIAKSDLTAHNFAAIKNTVTLTVKNHTAFASVLKLTLKELAKAKAVNKIEN